MANHYDALRQRVIDAGGSGDGWDFVDANGSIQRRKRNPHDVPVPDLDIMTPGELRGFLTTCSGPWWQKRLFPTRPIGYIQAARILQSLATLRLHYPALRSEFDRRYQYLPVWAQWRSRGLNVLACATPEQPFRRKPLRASKRGLESLAATINQPKKRR